MLINIPRSSDIVWFMEIEYECRETSMYVSASDCEDAHGRTKSNKHRKADQAKIYFRIWYRLFDVDKTASSNVSDKNLRLRVSHCL